MYLEGTIKCKYYKFKKINPIVETSVKLAPHFSKNEILVTVPNALRRDLKFLPKIKNSFDELIQKKKN